MKLVKILKALADENRLRILNILNHKELCVYDIESVLGITQSNASRHLIRLKEADLIDFQKQAQFVIYQINPAIVSQCTFLKEILEKEMAGVGKFAEDLRKLSQLMAVGLHEAIPKKTENK